MGKYNGDILILTIVDCREVETAECSLFLETSSLSALCDITISLIFCCHFLCPSLKCWFFEALISVLFLLHTFSLSEICSHGFWNTNILLSQFYPSYPYSQPPPGHIYLDLPQTSKTLHIRNWTFSCFLSLVLNLIEKPHFAPSCPNLKPRHHPWFLSPSQSLTYSVVSDHKYFKSSSTPHHSHCHDTSPEYRYLLCGFSQQPLTQSPFLHHWVLLNQTLPSHQKYLSTFISDDVTLQLANLYPFPWDYKIKSELLHMA